MKESDTSRDREQNFRTIVSIRRLFMTSAEHAAVNHAMQQFPAIRKYANLGSLSEMPRVYTLNALLSPLTSSTHDIMARDRRVLSSSNMMAALRKFPIDVLEQLAQTGQVDHAHEAFTQALFASAGRLPSEQKELQQVDGISVSFSTINICGKAEKRMQDALTKHDAGVVLYDAKGIPIGVVKSFGRRVLLATQDLLTQHGQQIIKGAWYSLPYKFKLRQLVSAFMNRRRELSVDTLDIEFGRLLLPTQEGAEALAAAEAYVAQVKTKGLLPERINGMFITDYFVTNGGAQEDDP